MSRAQYREIWIVQQLGGDHTIAFARPRQVVADGQIVADGTEYGLACRGYVPESADELWIRLRHPGAAMFHVGGPTSRPCFALLRGDHDDTVGSILPVERRRRSAFEHLDRLNTVRI